MFSPALACRQMLDDLKLKAMYFLWMALFIIMLISNHASKCNDPLAYDFSLLTIAVLGIIIWMSSYDNIS